MPSNELEWLFMCVCTGQLSAFCKHADCSGPEKNGPVELLANKRANKNGVYSKKQSFFGGTFKIF